MTQPDGSPPRSPGAPRLDGLAAPPPTGRAVILSACSTGSTAATASGPGGRGGHPPGPAARRVLDRPPAGRPSPRGRRPLTPLTQAAATPACRSCWCSSSPASCRRSVPGVRTGPVRQPGRQGGGGRRESLRPRPPRPALLAGLAGPAGSRWWRPLPTAATRWCPPRGSGRAGRRGRGRRGRLLGRPMPSRAWWSPATAAAACPAPRANPTSPPASPSRRRRLRPPHRCRPGRVREPQRGTPAVSREVQGQVPRRLGVAPPSGDQRRHQPRFGLNRRSRPTCSTTTTTCTHRSRSLRPPPRPGHLRRPELIAQIKAASTRPASCLVPQWPVRPAGPRPTRPGSPRPGPAGAKGWRLGFARR